MLTADDKRKIESYIDEGLIKKIKRSVENSKEKMKLTAEMNGIPNKIMMKRSYEYIVKNTIETTINFSAHESKMIMSSVYKMMKDHTFSEDYFSSTAHRADFYRIDILSAMSYRFTFEPPTEFPKIKNIDDAVNKYCENVKKALIRWINSLEKYYDEKINILKEVDHGSNNTRYISTLSKLFDKELMFGPSRIGNMELEALAVIMARYFGTGFAGMWKTNCCVGEYDAAEKQFNELINKLTETNISDGMDKLFEKVFRSDPSISIYVWPIRNKILLFDKYHDEMKRIMLDENPKLKGTWEEI